MYIEGILQESSFGFGYMGWGEITGARVTANGLEGRMANIAAQVVTGNSFHWTSRRRAGGR